MCVVHISTHQEWFQDFNCIFGIIWIHLRYPAWVLVDRTLLKPLHISSNPSIYKLHETMPSKAINYSETHWTLTRIITMHYLYQRHQHDYDTTMNHHNDPAHKLLHEPHHHLSPLPIDLHIQRDPMRRVRPNIPCQDQPVPDMGPTTVSYRQHDTQISDTCGLGLLSKRSSTDITNITKHDGQNPAPGL